MMNFGKIAFILIVFGALFSHANANDYLIKSQIYDNQKLIDSSTLTVKDKNESIVSVSDLYSLGIKLFRVDEETVKVAANLVMGDTRVSKTLVIELGNEETISNNGKKMTLLVIKQSNEEH